MMIRNMLVVGASLLMTAVAGQSFADGHPVNCPTAEGDIRVLESEKAHVGEQIVKGVTAVTPAGFVLGMVTGTEKKKLEIASGEYNEKIDMRIAKIKDTCGIK